MRFGDKEHQRRILELFEYDRRVRAHAIYEATAIEGLVESAIASHYCPDEKKHLSFIALLFGRGEVPFSKKIEILESLIKIDYPEVSKDYPQLINQLNALRRFRNKLAHHELITDEDKLEATPSGIWLRSVNRNGKIVEEFISAKDSDSLLKNTLGLRFEMLFVLSHISDKVSGRTVRTDQWNQILENLIGMIDKVNTKAEKRKKAEA